MKRKIITALLTGVAGLCLTLGLAACGSGGGNAGQGSDVLTPEQLDQLAHKTDPDYPGNPADNSGLTFQKSEDGSYYTVTGIKEDAELKGLVIPNSFGDLPVTAIAENAFSGHTEIESVNIAGSVTTIGDSAFSACTGIMSVRIPASVKTIGKSAFRSCTDLRAIIFAEGCTLSALEDSVFEGCVGLSAFTVPDSVTKISYHAFYNCSALASVDIGAGVKTIGEGVFQGCSALSSVNLRSVQTIESSAFAECSALKQITVPDTVDSFGENVFLHCTALEKMTIPFVGATRELANLKTTEPSRVETGGDSGIGSGSVEKSHFGYLFGAPTHSENNQKTEDYVPPTVEYVRVTGGNRLAEVAFAYCGNIKTIILGDSIQKIGFNVFAECGVENLVLGKNLNWIASAIMGNRAIYNSSASDTIPLYIYYMGTAADWENIEEEKNPDNGYENNNALHAAPIYYYSTTEQDAQHWRYVDDMPEVWAT